MNPILYALSVLVLGAYALWTLKRRGAVYALASIAPTGVITLAQAKLNATDDIDVFVIDEFRKSWTC